MESFQQRLLDHASAAYLGLAIGDALGSTVEFMTPREIQAKFKTHSEIIGGGWLKLKAGQVTDDTTMSLALGEVIIADRQVIDKSCAEAFLHWMKSKPVDIGNTVRRGLVRYRRTGIAHGEASEYDAGNGACMRTLPVALWSYGLPQKQVIQASHAQSHVTHNNQISDAATLQVITLIHMALAGEGRDNLLQQLSQFTQQYPLFDYSTSVQHNPSGYIVETLKAVFQALSGNDNFESILVDVVNRGGDADTTGAIVGMIAGAMYGLEGIPGRWLRAVDHHIAIACHEQAQSLIRLSVGFKYTD